jgi:pimeloyl-ACP methyl ester carboxylesterase
VATFETFDGLTLHHEDEGDGDVVVLLHGFAADANINWVRSGVFDALVGEGYRVVALDARGHGLSDKPHDSRAYEDDAMARDVRCLLDHLGAERCAVVGFSMGAVTALRVARLDERVRTASIIGMTADNLDPPLRQAQRAQVIEGLLAEDPAALADPMARQFRTLADSVRADRHALAAYTAAERVSAESEIAEVTVPVLVIVGADDTYAAPADSLAARMPGGHALTVPGDHFGCASQPEVHEALVKFLAG